MGLMLTRSSYLVSRGARDNTATVEIDMFLYNGTEATIFQSYTLKFRDSQYLDLSPILNSFSDDYPIFRFTASINGGGAGKTSSYKGFAVDGFYYTEEGNSVTSFNTLRERAYYAGSSDVIYKYGDDAVTLPFICPEDEVDYPSTKSILITLQFYNGSTLLKTSTIGFLSDEYYGDFTANAISYISSGNANSNLTFRERVVADGGVYENNYCTTKFEDSMFDDPLTNVVITTSNGYSHEIKVVDSQECRHPRQLVKFKNKYGVFEELWFLAKSTESISVEYDKFRANNVADYSVGNLKHSYRQLNKNGIEKISINTGFVAEEMNEAYKQLMLSEEVYLFKNGIQRPVNIVDSDFQFKYHRNEKLINYNMQLEFGNDIINNIN